jgi:GNAT superfamily N-acetyltransferase
VTDVPLILELIRGLAEYERLPHEVVATEALLADQLFGEHPGAEVLLAEWQGEPVGFALFCHNFSTFLGRRGLWLEDLFVVPACRGRGIGRLEWSVLDWNVDAIGFYRSLGARPMDEWTTFRLTGDALDQLATEAGTAAG